MEIVESEIPFYVVIMHRWGDPESHSYFLGVFSTLQKAIDNGEEERLFRRNKYFSEITECYLNNNSQMKKIKVEDKKLGKRF